MLAEGIVELVADIKQRYAGLTIEEMCEALGYKVRTYPMGDEADACRGFLLRRFGISCIMINSDLSRRSQQIILAHEMGHACLHEQLAEESDFIDIGRNGYDSICEHEANVFAAEMLISDEEILDLISAGVSLDAIASELEVPLELADYKVRILQKKGLPLRPFLYANSNFMKDVVP